MQLVITEKNDAAKKIAELLGDGKPKADKVYETAVYRFKRGAEEWVSIGLRGHILEVDFVEELAYSKKQGWYGVDKNGVIVPATAPDSLVKPPFKKRRPFTVDSVSLKGWNVASLPYLIYAPLEKLPKEKGIIRSIKNLAGKASNVIIATDFDREGELIGSDALAMVLEAAPGLPATRARYSAFTKEEIHHAFANLVEVDMNLAQAGESRQWIDLIWGAVLTRYLTLARFAGIGNTRPAGRVQTPTLALVVAREEERNAFVPEDYWVLKALCDANGEPFEATHATARFKDEAQARDAYAAVRDVKTATVQSIERKQRKVPAPTPFNTTSLQAAAAAEGLTPARTMRIAESLYMDGYISYPRVDNTVYPDSLDLRETVQMLSQVPAYNPFATALLRKDKLTATRGKTFTTDHPPIYPTGIASPDKLRPEEWKLYNLVARRFMATLSGPATVEGTKVSLDAAGQPFVAKGDVLVQPGFREIYPYGLKKDEQLPRMEQGQAVGFAAQELLKKQTEPPARYSQGRLIQEMEKHGLGTKSTRHAIIERLMEVRYIQNDPVEPTALGMAVVDALGKFAPHITTPQMTAELEDEMNAIAAGENSRDSVVAHSRNLLDEVMVDLIPRKDEVGDALSDAVNADAYIGKCPKCGQPLLLKHSPRTRSSFVGCSGYPDCDVTFGVPQGKIEAVEEPCPTCGKPQIKLTQFRTKPLIRCVDPDCPSNQEPELKVGDCSACADAGRHGDLIAQRNPRSMKRFIRCTNYDLCNTSYPLPQRGELIATDEYCEACGAPKVIIKTARGPWEICPNFNCPSREEAEKLKAEKAAKPKTRKSTAKKPAKKTTRAKAKKTEAS